ncbi:tRNA (guanosine(46)-N7)-methyltransferase TrmB [Putridiphycobacter roseus]|uniref:tRNA (guanine-N(7)-)-methyltransferase n=1 Tax=Putridiphycobacter roseus TaxID=2219161 RepID=A0A2W1NC26_9FLAO|nr:tRNA (guanosine(46)-N7)-methyltransferase TrmB [Putridiphycobacter roseus]PZE16895.1 tRNA (guanosine(46)-N7)-methyltransferase TrmB [Putridiphycobacter roseus]
MAKNKLKHFADMKTMPFVFEPSIDLLKKEGFAMQGKWHKDFFKNDHPIVLELGCGKGEYTVALAEMNPEKNFIGIDIKGARIWYGADFVRENKMQNVSFVRTKIDFITEIFGEGEVDEIWLTFSDPQKEKPNKRLTAKIFMDRYKKILKPGGTIHLKTDSDILFEFTLEEIEKYQYNCLMSSWHLYDELMDKLPIEEQNVLNIKTNYETIFSNKGYAIKYCKIQLD